MSLTKLFLSVLAVLIVVSTGFMLLNRDAAPPAEPVVEQQPQTPPPPKPVYDTATAPENITDEGITADIADLDAKIGELENDAANVDAGMTDKPLPIE